MRIIDKNKDYYDFYQDIYRDDTFVFDRRDSYPLTKEEFAKYFYQEHYGYRHDYTKRHILLLQICHTYWLMELFITSETTLKQCADYELKLLANWQNYDKPREMLKLSIIEFKFWLYNNDDSQRLIDAINTGNYKEIHVFDNFVVYKGYATSKEVRHIPILKGIGIPALIDAFDIYRSLEEYFSEEKTASERTEAIGATNDDKIISHGFDSRTSFRNCK